jgi:hypothetical protein
MITPPVAEKVREASLGRRKDGPNLKAMPERETSAPSLSDIACYRYLDAGTTAWRIRSLGRVAKTVRLLWNRRRFQLGELSNSPAVLPKLPATR